MAMILIEKDNATLKIPYGAYEKLYKPQGWVRSDEEAEEVAEDKGITTPEDDDWDDEEEEGIVKDIRKMNMEELKTLASNKNVDISKCKNIGDLRSTISKALNV